MNEAFYKNITMKLTQRYYIKSIHSSHKKRIQGMINSLNDKSINWPIDKTNRWLGFIQGVLFVEGLISVDEERDFTRTMFHSFYESTGQKIPNTIDVLK